MTTLIAHIARLILCNFNNPSQFMSAQSVFTLLISTSINQTSSLIKTKPAQSLYLYPGLTLKAFRKGRSAYNVTNMHTWLATKPIS